MGWRGLGNLWHNRGIRGGDKIQVGVSFVKGIQILLPGQAEKGKSSEGIDEWAGQAMDVERLHNW